MSLGYSSEEALDLTIGLGEGSRLLSFRYKPKRQLRLRAVRQHLEYLMSRYELSSKEAVQIASDNSRSPAPRFKFTRVTTPLKLRELEQDVDHITSKWEIPTQQALLLAGSCLLYTSPSPRD